MLQILGTSMMVATRMDSGLGDRRHHTARPQQSEQTEARERRRGWVHFAGILL